MTGGSCESLFDERANIPPKIIMNTLISGCTSSVLAVYIKPQVLGTFSFVSRYDCVASGGGFLAGLVAVSGSCDQLEPYGAFIIGIVSSLVYVGSCKLMDILHIIREREMRSGKRSAQPISSCERSSMKCTKRPMMAFSSFTLKQLEAIT